MLLFCLFKWKVPTPGQAPGNVSQDCNDDEADENTYEDDADIDDLDPSLILTSSFTQLSRFSQKSCNPGV